MNTFNHLQRQLIDDLACATAVLHRLAGRCSHLTKRAQLAIAKWNRAKDRLLAAPHGRRCWLCFCNLYRYNVKSVALDFFI